MLRLVYMYINRYLAYMWLFPYSLGASISAFCILHFPDTYYVLGAHHSKTNNKKKYLQPRGQCHKIRIQEYSFKDCFHTVLCFKLKTTPFPPLRMDQSRTKGNISAFFPFFPSTLGRARHGAKKEGDVTKGKNHPVWLWWGKKGKTNCIMYGGLNDVCRKRVFLWITAMGKTADLIKSTAHVDVPRLWEKGTLNNGLGFKVFLLQFSRG